MTRARHDTARRVTPDLIALYKRRASRLRVEACRNMWLSLRAKIVGFQTAKREAFEVTSPRPCGERSSGEAQRSRAGEGLSPRTQRVERAPHPALSP